jgi:DNA-binding NarL/FixJ family response regulator
MEIRVLKLYLELWSTKKVADSVHRSPQTVDTYYYRVRMELGFHTNTQLMVEFDRWQRERSSARQDRAKLL